jgi:hypothetical protein
MFIKKLVTGLGACAILMAGLWHPGNAKASFIDALDIKAISLEQIGSRGKHKAEPGVDLKKGFSSLLLANQRNSSFRKDNTRKKSQNRGTGYRTNRQNNPRFIQRGSKASFFNQNLRSYSKRGSFSNGRSSVRGNNFKNNLNIYKRPKSRNFTFITPRKTTR